MITLERIPIKLVTAVNATASQVMTTDYIALDDGTVALYLTCTNSGGATAVWSTVTLDVTLPGATADVSVTAGGPNNQTGLSKSLANWIGTDCSKGQVGWIVPFDADLTNVALAVPQFAASRCRIVLTRDATVATGTFTIRGFKLRAVQTIGATPTYTAPGVV